MSSTSGVLRDLDSPFRSSGLATTGCSSAVAGIGASKTSQISLVSRTNVEHSIAALRAHSDMAANHPQNSRVVSGGNHFIKPSTADNVLSVVVVNARSLVSTWDGGTLVGSRGGESGSEHGSQAKYKEGGDVQDSCCRGSRVRVSLMTGSRSKVCSGEDGDGLQWVGRKGAMVTRRDEHMNERWSWPSRYTARVSLFVMYCRLALNSFLRLMPRGTFRYTVGEA